MELNVKTIIAGIALFGLGGLSVYLLNNSTEQPAGTNAAVAATNTPNTSVSDIQTAETTSAGAESFYEAADARREQHLADKEEADRLAKLKAIKERSVECKFWKQQQKTTSASAKIENKINEHCNLPSSSAASESNAAPSKNTDSSIPSAN